MAAAPAPATSSDGRTAGALPPAGAGEKSAGHNARTPLVVAIAGGTGSGKTSVAKALRRAIGDEYISFLSHDSYYKDLSHLPVAERALCNFDHPNSLDTDLLVSDVKKLRDGQAVAIPMYDFTTHSRLVDQCQLDPRPVIIVEGILLFTEPALRDLFDIKIFVDAEADIRLIRRLHRDKIERGRNMDSVIRQYLNTVRPMHIEFVEPSKRFADVIVPEGGHNKIALEMIVSRIRAELQEI